MLFDDICSLLNQHGVVYEIKQHPPTRTSEESAQHRGEPLKIGAKALLLKTDNYFLLTVIPANRKLDMKKVRTAHPTKNLRLATPEELWSVAHCEKGAVPPFGPLMNIIMAVDQRLFEEEYMAFNAGSLEISIKMKSSDYRRSVYPDVVDIAVE